MILVLAVILLHMSSLPVFGEVYDVVILNGRVMDPESNMNTVRNIGISKGVIKTITTDPCQGVTTINAQGLVVSPGFIDLHVHMTYQGRDITNFSIKAMDGVTTALDLESGARDLDNWYGAREGKSLINYGASASHMDIRMMTSAGVKRAASASELQVIKQGLEKELQRGAVGIGLLIQYIPEMTREEILEIFKVAKKFNAPCYVHIRSSDMSALQEVIDAADATKGSLHVVHINSMGLGNTLRFLQVIGEARSRGLDVTTECYPYTTAATGIRSAIFDKGWQEKLGINYKDLEWAATGERLTEKTFDGYRRIGGIVIVHLMSEDIIEASVTHPLTMIASDSLVQDGKGHPRSSGTFSRVLGQYVREKKALSLMDALRKMTLMPAQHLEGRIPEMKNKGRIRIGADADITIFDPTTVIDRATYKEPVKFSDGIKYVLVNGVFVVRDGQLQTGMTPGKPVRAPVK